MKHAFRRHGIIALIVLLATWSQASSGAVGFTQGQADVTASGAATYRIPIFTPPGINGLTPELALLYNHRDQESIAGVGWGVSGLSQIIRCASSVAQNGGATGASLTQYSRYCLDGNQLRHTSGTYGAAGSTYRTEVDLMARITANGTAGGGPAWFKVEAKDGLIYEYGNSTDSRIESLAPCCTTTARSWALNKISDRSGNEIRFVYTEDGAPFGSYRISYIEYRLNPSAGISTAGYRIDFSYEDQPVGDNDTRYGAGGIIEDVRRLTQVNVTYAVTGTLVRHYAISYEPSLSSTNRSRIQSIQECAGSPLQCFAPTTMTYSDGTHGLDNEVLSGTSMPSGTKPLSLDINGDGRTDLAYPSSSSGGKWVYRLANASGGYSSAVTTSINSTEHLKAIVTDYNADGIEDILVPYSGGTWWAIQGSVSGGLQAPVNTGAPATSNAGDALTIDMNGDGREDLVWREAFNGVKLRHRLASGGYEATPITILSNSGFKPKLLSRYKKNRRARFDVNGDGREDLLVFGFPPPGEHWLYVVLGGFVGFWTDTSIAGPQVKALPVDFNGDGYTDVVTQRPGYDIKYRMSTGTALATAVTLPNTSGLDLNLAVPIDWDSDGYQDFVAPNSSTGTWYVLRSQGYGFAAAANTGIASSSPSSTFLADVDGDGLDDVAFAKSNAQFAYRPHSGVAPDLIDTITDGNGNTVTFEFAPLTDSSVYTRYNTGTFPQQDYAKANIGVVSTLTRSDGVGGSYDVSYTYAGAQLDMEGRGISGFDKRTIQDQRNGNKVTEYYHRDFPFRGRSYQTNLNLSDGTLVQRIDYSWLSLAAGSGYETYAYPYLAQSTEKNYEAGGAYNGNQLNEIVTTTAVDTYGTPTTITRTSTELSSGNGAQSGAVFTEQMTNTSISNSTSSWCLGQAGRTDWINSHNQTYGSQITRTITRTWNTSTLCRLTQEVVQPGSGYQVTRALGYDGFGNVNSETVTGSGMAARTTSTNWGSTGQLPISVTNPLSQTTTRSWDYAKGVQLSETDPNGLVVSRQFDVFGRLSRETRVDGTYTDITLTACTSANSWCGTTYNKAVTKIHASSKKTNGTQIRYDDSFLDQQNRTVQVENQTLSGAMSRVRTVYDAFGRVYQQSAPSFATNPAYYTTTSYDALGRATDIARPIDSNNPALQHTTVAYTGLTTTTTDAEGKTAKTIRDAMDRTFRSVDHAGYYQQFNYDAFGSVRRVLDSLGANLMLATYAYGIDAFRLTSNDMDLGAWSYTPNALGEVVGHSDAKGQSFTASFDKLSRPLTRVEPGNTTAWTWGTSSAAHNIGRLASVSATGHSESYSYDNKGRLSQRSTVADATYLTNFAYDSTSGQLDSLQYPTSTSGYRLKLKYNYQYGILQKVSDFAVPSTVFWQANAADARGNVVDELLGNGLKTLRGYDEVTGMPQSIQSGPGGGSSRQNMSFQWNKVGSLKQRKDLNRTLTEDFYYDNLHRLDYSKLNAVQNLDVGYDARGNITSKSDVGGGTWTYHASKKHAVISAGSNSFSYDANGNQITRNSDDITWTSYNYPSRIENGARYHDYYYDAHRQRWKQVYFNGSSSETTIFVGGILEKRTAAGITEYRHAIKVGRQPVALYTRPTSGSVTTEYFLLDHLGSVAEVTSSSGAVVVSESFSAFGGRRDPTDWSGGLSAGDEALIAGITPRGYTFHTHLESSSLIHMNGRVMDSLTGRFLSADPYVAEPYLTQGFNRYSYVNNNPLTFTDPSGFCADPSGASAFFCATAFASALSYAIDGLFGRSNVKRPPPDYCFIAGPEACLTSAASLSQPISSDVHGHPLLDDIASGRIALRCGRWDNECLLAIDIVFGVFRDFTPIGSGVDAKIAWDEGNYVHLVIIGVAQVCGPGKKICGSAKRIVPNKVPNVTLRGSQNPKVAEAAAKGRKAHADHDYGPGFDKEVTLPSGKRADAVNFETREVVELKPNNPNAIRRGERQAEGYRQELEEVTGECWTCRVETYD